MNLQIYESEGSVISNMYRNIPVRYVAAMVIGVCRLISSLALARSSSPLAHCFTIFIKSSGYRNIDDCHRNPNINIREIIWLGATTHDRRSTSHYKNNTSIYFHRILLCFVILRSPRLLTIFSVLQARQKHGRTHHRHSKRLHKIPDL